MAQARGLPLRTLSVVFGAYFLVILVVAYALSPTIAPYVWPAATRWITAAYVLLGAVVLVGVSLVALRRWTRLDARLAELEVAQREDLMLAATEAPASTAGQGAHPPIPSDQDVEELLRELHEIGEEVAVDKRLSEDRTTRAEPPDEATAKLRKARSREIRRLMAVRDAVARAAAGPVVASALLLGVFAALLPASDAMLVADLRLNAFLGVAGAGCLAGIVAYAAAAFRRLGRRAT